MILYIKIFFCIAFKNVSSSAIRFTDSAGSPALNMHDVNVFVGSLSGIKLVFLEKIRFNKFYRW